MKFNQKIPYIQVKRPIKINKYHLKSLQDTYSKKVKDLKFVSFDISVSFMMPVSKYKILCMLYLQCQLKNGFNGEHCKNGFHGEHCKNGFHGEHCKNFHKVSNEIKQYAKNTIVKSH